MWGGIWFQILGPQTYNLKACYPTWAIVLTATAALVVEERSLRRLGLEKSLAYITGKKAVH